MELSPRLRRIAQEVPPHARLADVGTDHAYLPVSLLLEGKINCCIVTDLRQGPLHRAEQNARQFGVASGISFRLCDGLSGVFPEEVDTVAIAGMGGETIAGILQAAPWTGEGNRLFLLQPMSSISDLRSWLQQNRFTVQREYLVTEGKKYYVIMVVRPGQSPALSNAELCAGRQWRGMAEPFRVAYLEELKRRTRAAAAGLAGSAPSPERQVKLRELESLADGLNDMKKEWESWQR